MSQIPPKSQFPDTRWSLIVSARSVDDEGCSALQELCQGYWYPLYAHARRAGNSADDAADLTQSFFAHLIASNALARADQNMGRFRSYLLSAMQNFIRQEWRRSNARRRGGGVELVSIDKDRAEERLSAETAVAHDQEREFDRRWAREVLDKVFGELGESYTRRGKGNLFNVLAPFLDGDAAEGYRAAAQRLGIAEASARVAVFRLRKQFRRRLRRQIAETLDNPMDVDEEIDLLLAALRAE